MRGFSTTLLSAVLAISLSQGEEEKPKYRCLAPFVWQLEANPTPSNLFEAFLSGPFERVDGEWTADELIDEGWLILVNGDLDDARAYFREAWVRYESGKALVSLAFSYYDDPGFRSVFARESLKHMPPQSPGPAIVKVLLESEDVDADLNAFVAQNPGHEFLTSFLIKRQIENAESIPGAFREPLESYLKEIPGLGSLPIQLAAKTGAWNGDVPEDARSGTMRTAFLESIEEGKLTTACEIATKLLADFPEAGSDPATVEGMIALSRGLDRSLSAEKWMAVSAAVSPESGADKKGVTGGLADKVEEIVALYEEGEVKNALFQIDQSLAEAIKGSDREGEWLEAIGPILGEAERNVEDWIGEVEPVLIPEPVFSDLGSVSGLTLTDSNGETVGHDTPVLFLFYTGVGCPACQVELQAFRALAEKFEKEGVQLVAVSPQDGEETNKALAESDMSFPFSFVGDPDLKVFETLNMVDEYENYPLHGAVLVGKGGDVFWSIRGYAPVTDAEKVLQAVKSVLRIR